MGLFIPGETVVTGASLTDLELVQRVRQGDGRLFEILMRRHNQRVFRAARAVVKDDCDAEDVMQQAYVNAFSHLHQFEERAQFSTWLTRIALNEAFARRRKVQSEALADVTSNLAQDSGAFMATIRSPQPDPERQAYAEELRRVLEDAIDALEETYRTVFVLRDIEGLSTSATGEALGLRDEVVRTRLHRARAMIRRAVTARIGAVAPGVFQFEAPRCDRVVAAVFARIGIVSAGTQCLTTKERSLTNGREGSASARVT